MLIAERSQKQFVAQWATTGDLNGHIEEMHTGHAIVKLFGRQQQAIAAVRRRERAPLPGQLQGPVHLRHHPAGDELHLEPQLRRHRGHRRAAGGERPACRLGDVGRSSSTPASSRCRSSRWRASSTSSSPPSRRPSACSSCSTRPRRSPDPVAPRARSSRRARRGRLRGRRLPLPARQAAHRRPRPRRRARPDRRHRRPDRRRQDHPRQPADALLRRRRRPDHASTGSTPGSSRATTCAGRSGWSSRTRGCSTARSARTSPTAAAGATEDEVIAAAEAAHVDHFVQHAARRLRHRARRRRDQRLGRREAAAHHRPRVPRRPADPHPRRGHPAPWTRAPRSSSSGPW